MVPNPIMNKEQRKRIYGESVWEDKKHPSSGLT